MSNDLYDYSDPQGNEARGTATIYGASMAEASAAGVQAGDSTYLAGHKIQNARMNRGLAQLSTPSTGSDSYAQTGPDILASLEPNHWRTVSLARVRVLF